MKAKSTHRKHRKYMFGCEVRGDLFRRRPSCICCMLRHRLRGHVIVGLTEWAACEGQVGGQHGEGMVSGL